MYWRIINPVFLVHAFNVKSILCIVDYMIISNIHNRTPKSNFIFTAIYIWDFFNRHEFMKHCVKFMFYFYYLWAKIEPKRRYEWLWAKRGRRSRPRGAQRSSFHNLLFAHTNYVLCKGLKLYNHNKLTFFRKGFSIRCAILVNSTCT